MIEDSIDLLIMKVYILCILLITIYDIDALLNYKFINRKNSCINMLSSAHPIASLEHGQWVKLICGASNQDIPLIRNICTIYTIAGVDCIDLSADPAVTEAAREGVNAGMKLNNHNNQIPFLMISVNDDEDPHFRKAQFDPEICPSDCKRPCEKVCPAFAIPSIEKLTKYQSNINEGVISNRCYGCGRCVPICPYGYIKTTSYSVDTNTINTAFNLNKIEAIEIHTQFGHEDHFSKLWSSIGDDVLQYSRVIAVSFPYMNDDTLPYLNKLFSIMSHHPKYKLFQGVHVWQTDGRPMSGDIGKGTTHACTQLASYILNNKQLHDKLDFNNGKHFIQLAGGTNDYTSTLVKNENLHLLTGFGGYAFGGYARKEINHHLQELEEKYPGSRIEDHPIQFQNCLNIASRLIQTVKG